MGVLPAPTMLLTFADHGHGAHCSLLLSLSGLGLSRHNLVCSNTTISIGARAHRLSWLLAAAWAGGAGQAGWESGRSTADADLSLARGSGLLLPAAALLEQPNTPSAPLPCSAGAGWRAAVGRAGAGRFGGAAGGSGGAASALQALAGLGGRGQRHRPGHIREILSEILGPVPRLFSASMPRFATPSLVCGGYRAR